MGGAFEGYRLLAAVDFRVAKGAAYLAWHLATLARTNPHAIGALGWILFAYQLLGVFVSRLFFSGFVLLAAAVTAVCIGWATWLVSGQHPAQQARSERALA